MDYLPNTLTTRQQQLVALSAYTSKSDVAGLKIAFNDALDAGLTINEINEVLAHLYAYTGFSPSIRGIHLFREVVDERKAGGIHDPMGRDASPIADATSRYDRGEAAQMVVTAMTAEQLKTLFVFNPLIDTFLKEHLFADIFGRDLLSYIDREIVTVTSLVTMHEPFVRSHIGGALNVGVTPAQLRHIFALVAEQVGQAEADMALTVLDDVLRTRETA